MTAIDSGRVLVIDVGTSGVRSMVIGADARVQALVHQAVLPDSPAPGLVEIDPVQIADAVMSTALKVLEEGGPVDGLGIANQRASTIVWDRVTGQPVGLGLGWQDLRTVGECLVHQASGIRLAPNESATKIAWLLDQSDPERTRDLCFGTVDTWVAWTLSGGSLHVTDASNAGLTGLLRPDGTGWDYERAAALNIPGSALPAIVDSSGAIGEASALPGNPTICALVGDQQASLVGQGCTQPGLAKATFGTGGMLDVCVGPDRPAFERWGESGTFPIVAFRRARSITWGAEAVMLSAGSCVEWLRDDLGLISDSAESGPLAATADPASDVWFVPSLLGLGAPVWDFGARGTLTGLTRGSGRAEIVRAVLDGVAHRGADLIEAAEADTGLTLSSLRIDGGMSANEAFVTALAEGAGIPVEISPVLEATGLGAGFLAGLAVGIWSDEEAVAQTWRPDRVIEPTWSQDQRQTTRSRWATMRARAERTIPELSDIHF